MGRDKALIMIDGVAMAQRGIDAVRRAGARRVAIVGARPEHDLLDAEPVADVEPGAGPLAGVLSALRWAPQFPLVTLPCDLPRVTAESVTLLHGSLTPGADVVLAAIGGRSSLLAGAWNESALPHLLAAFNRGIRSMTGAVEGLNIIEVSAGGAFDDVDTPGQLAATRYRVGMAPVPHIDIAELVSMHPVAVILDVREPDEYQEAHVPGALLIPLGQLIDRLHEVPDANPLVVICRSGARSLHACVQLAEGGRDVVNVTGGTLAWIAAGHEVATGMERG